MSLIANVNRDTTKRPQPFSAEDFVPEWGAGDTPDRTDEELFAKASATFAALGGVRR